MSKKFKVVGNTLSNGDVYHPVPVGAEVTLVDRKTVFGGNLYHYTGLVHYAIDKEHVEPVEAEDTVETLPLPTTKQIPVADDPSGQPVAESPAEIPSAIKEQAVKAAKTK